MATVLVVLAGLIAAIVSATTGVAGGVMLLACLVLVVPAAAIVPLHATVQLVAGSSRAIAYRKFVDWGIVARFGAALLPGSVLGMVAVKHIATWDPAILEVAIAIVILGSVLRLDTSASDSSVRGVRGMYVWGFVCGVLGVIVGSTGPLVSRALLARGIAKEEHVATKSYAQALAHLIKLPLYGLALDFRFDEHAVLATLLCAAAIVGTLIGRRLLRFIPTERSILVTRVLLGVIATSILVRHAVEAL